MLDELKTAKKLIGIKQALKAAQSDQVKKAFIAKNAEARVTEPLRQLCEEKNIEIEYVETKEELGKACNIEVSAAVAVIID